MDQVVAENPGWGRCWTNRDGPGMGRVGAFYGNNLENFVDVGIGSGAFMERVGCNGYDVNPVGVNYLKKNDKYHDIYEKPADVMTFWDSLEHIESPFDALDNVSDMAFISCPIYESIDDLIDSKHFRTDEHFWYWTVDGFKLFMNIAGFDIIAHETFEQKCGRESIHSFACKRRV